MTRSARHATVAAVISALAIGAGVSAAAAASATTTSPQAIVAQHDLTTATAGCSGGSPAKSATITIRNFTFLQCPDTVKPGEKITVHNDDGVTHTLTATSPAGAFNTGNIPSGKSRTFKAPKKAGKYHYECAIHPFMLGTLIVS